ncbi:MAG: fimbrillin family protein [Bacteroidales bacterium]
MGTELAQGSQIGVFVFNNGTKTSYTGSKNESNDGLNQAWTNSNKGWTGDSFILGIQPADVYAYFPRIHSASPLSDNTIQPSYDAIPVAPGYTDYMYGKSTNTVNSTSSNANIQLNHALAMISFTFTKGTGYPTNEACQVNAITIKNLPASGTMSVVDGISTPENHVTGTDTLAVKGFVNNSYIESGIDGWNIAEFNFKPIEDNSNKQIGTVTGNPVVTAPLFHALVLPNTGMPNKENITDSELHAVIKIDGVNYKISLSVNKDSSGTDSNENNKWESNKHYTYNLKISGTSGQGNQLEVSSVTVRQWEQGGSSDIEI